MRKVALYQLLSLYGLADGGKVVIGDKLDTLLEVEATLTDRWNRPAGS